MDTKATKKNDARLHAEYETVALVLQGGGALGSYQCGIYEGLAEAGIHPNWVAGISIGALNAAIIAGNAPERRVEQLRAFWQTICRQPYFPPTPVDSLRNFAAQLPSPLAGLLGAWEATRALIEGQNGFFVPRLPPPFAPFKDSPESASFYDTSLLRDTLEQFADFDRINSHEMRVSVGAVNVRTGNFAYFDNREMRLAPEHFMASGALPPGFPAVKIGGEYYWDGGMVSNTPLFPVLQAHPRRHSLVFQVDLWSSRGVVPRNLSEVVIRQKDIQYSSRTRMVTAYMQELQEYRGLLRELMEQVPQAQREKDSAYARAARMACDRRFNVIHLIYRDKECEGGYKDFQFGVLSMEEHWRSGIADIAHTLQHPEWFEMPPAEKPFVTHDVHRAERVDAG